MAYSEKEKINIWNNILAELMTGRSLRSVLTDPDTPSRETVYNWIIHDKKKSDQYARASDIRADCIFDEMMDISDSTDEDIINLDNGKQAVNHNVINRDKLRIDTRKWILSKMNPKKYGDRLELDNNHTFNPKDIKGITFDE